jgi:protein LSM14
MCAVVTNQPMLIVVFYRYVGTLVEINSKDSTVALENVMSYGTEERRTGEDSFPPSSSLYDYILFRGSDVKDLRIEEPPKETVTGSKMPNDPAILGVRHVSNFPPLHYFYYDEAHRM